MHTKTALITDSVFILQWKCSNKNIFYVKRVKSNTVKRKTFDHSTVWV